MKVAVPLRRLLGTAVSRPQGGLVVDPMVAQLLQSSDAALRYQLQTGVLGFEPDDPTLVALRLTVRESPTVRALLAQQNDQGCLPHHPYQKWLGSLWTLVQLADLGYPTEAAELIPLREQAYAWLFSPAHERNIPVIRGRARRCASQEGNALLALLTLGLNDQRSEELAQRLLYWQWPDGGWNCDRRPEAVHSSYHETLIPLRALALHGRRTGDLKALRAVEQGAEVLLKRQLFLRQSTNQAIEAAFVKLHYPYYWRYNILYALRVMGEIGAIGDPRCARALELVESKRLPGGGWPAELRYYSVYKGGHPQSGASAVDWGGVNQRKANPWVTAQALAVLRAAGRVDAA